jgi:hypothetical protein
VAKSKNSLSGDRRASRQVDTIGWREWLQLPDLGVPRIKVKVDTGARSSSLHAFNLQVCELDGRQVLKFEIHPLQNATQPAILTTADLVEFRRVRSSTGHEELRPVIRTLARLGTRSWPIEITLTNRDEMGFRMLLGRRAIINHFVVDPARSYLCSKRSGN